MNTITELQKYHNEINERCNKLLAFIKSDNAKLIHEDDRHLISLEYGAASELLCVLRRRIERASEKPETNIEWADPSEFWKEEFMVQSNIGDLQ
ncbi:MAG: hypothetical protein ACRCXB_31325 [Aeromonadaceae bacterium]